MEGWVTSISSWTRFVFCIAEIFPGPCHKCSQMGVSQIPGKLWYLWHWYSYRGCSHETFAMTSKVMSAELLSCLMLKDAETILVYREQRETYTVLHPFALFTCTSHARCEWTRALSRQEPNLNTFLDMFYFTSAIGTGFNKVNQTKVQQIAFSNNHDMAPLFFPAWSCTIKAYWKHVGGLHEVSIIQVLFFSLHWSATSSDADSNFKVE